MAPPVNPSVQAKPQCGICLEDLEGTQYQPNGHKECAFSHDGRMVRLACGHAYHSKCMEAQLKAGTSNCGHCRKPLSDRDIEIVNKQLNLNLKRRTADDVYRDVYREGQGSSNVSTQDDLGLWLAERQADRNHQSRRRCPLRNLNQRLNELFNRHFNALRVRRNQLNGFRLINRRRPRIYNCTPLDTVYNLNSNQSGRQPAYRVVVRQPVAFHFPLEARIFNPVPVFVLPPINPFVPFMF